MGTVHKLHPRTVEHDNQRALDSVNEQEDHLAFWKVLVWVLLAGAALTLAMIGSLREECRTKAYDKITNSTSLVCKGAKDD